MASIRIRNFISALSKIRPAPKHLSSSIRPIQCSVNRQQDYPRAFTLRHYSTETSPYPPLPHATDPKPSANVDGTSSAQFPLAEKPAYELTMTCKPCQTRTTHRVSKQGYHKGTVLIRCPSCKARHLIADHLKIFRDNPTTLEDIMKEKGELIQKGFKNANGDVEFLPPDSEVEDESPPSP